MTELNRCTYCGAVLSRVGCLNCEDYEEPYASYLTSYLDETPPAVDNWEEGDRESLYGLVDQVEREERWPVC